MMVFDKTARESFNHITDWHEEINKYSENSSRVLVGNKYDMTEHIQVDEETGKQLAEKLGMHYIETSAMNSYQVTTAFELIARELIQKKGSQQERGKKLNPVKTRKPLSSSCCQN
mmetsp:Transcript_18570/g.18550  ORF Transcript_18570/g.18550 Transcript_18570/m.18550 type:complete len:115 (+) Transcript_18570:263-607(+)